MTFDADLADRMRDLLAEEPGLTEKKMFGGLAFLVGGNMAIAASGQGGALVRVDPADSARLVAKTSARMTEMRGWLMLGILRVDADDIRTQRQLSTVIDRAASVARPLREDLLSLLLRQFPPMLRLGDGDERSARRLRPREGLLAGDKLGALGDADVAFVACHPAQAPDGALRGPCVGSFD